MDGIVLPLASKLHGKEYYTSVYINIRKCLEEFEGLDFYPEIITESVEPDLGEYKYLVLVHLTGGGFTVTYPTIIWVGSDEPVLTTVDAIVFYKIGTTLYGKYLGEVA